MYTISFTTLKQITRYGAKREVLEKIDMHTPIVMHGLPYPTAMQYSACADFQIQREAVVAQDRVAYRKPKEQTSDVGPATRLRGTGVTRKRVSREEAASTGDLGAAISGGE